MTRDIDYGNLMHSAMRGLIKTVLQDIAENGLPGQHHFFITFDTTHPDVAIADWLRDRYPRRREPATVVSGSMAVDEAPRLPDLLAAAPAGDSTTRVRFRLLPTPTKNETASSSWQSRHFSAGTR